MSRATEIHKELSGFCSLLHMRARDACNAQTNHQRGIKHIFGHAFRKGLASIFDKTEEEEFGLSKIGSHVGQGWMSFVCLSHISQARHFFILHYDG